MSTATHRPPSHPEWHQVWWTTSWLTPSKLGATQPPWTSVGCRLTAGGRRLEGTSECLLTAFFTKTGTLLTGRVAPLPTPFSPAGMKWRVTHTLMMMRSGAMEVFTDWSDDGWIHDGCVWCKNYNDIVICSNELRKQSSLSFCLFSDVEL